MINRSITLEVSLTVAAAAEKAISGYGAKSFFVDAPASTVKVQLAYDKVVTVDTKWFDVGTATNERKLITVYDAAMWARTNTTVNTVGTPTCGMVGTYSNGAAGA